MPDLVLELNGFVEFMDNKFLLDSKNSAAKFFYRSMES